MSLVVNGISVASMRWFAAWTGVWSAELEILGDVLPAGRVAIVSTEGIALVGSVDPENTRTFGERRSARVVGGGGGWSKPVRPQHFNSSVGVPLASLVSATAAEAGEVAVVALPMIVGTDFARRGAPAPASQIFIDAGVDWWVGLDGITRVGVRLPVVPHPSFQITDYDGSTGTASFVCDVLVEPGTIVADVRLLAPLVVRQIEAIVSGASVTGTLWLAEPPVAPGTIDDLGAELAALARAATRAELGRLHEYRVIAMAGDRVELQAVAPLGSLSAPDGVPDILPASIWAGISGYRATLFPSSRCLVGFIGGDPRRPYVAAYEPPEGGGWRPVKLELDAIANVTIGEQALSVVIGGATGAFPIARVTPSLATWIAAVSTYINGLAPGTAIPPTDLASTKAVAT